MVVVFPIPLAPMMKWTVNGFVAEIGLSSSTLANLSAKEGAATEECVVVVSSFPSSPTVVISGFIIFSFPARTCTRLYTDDDPPLALLAAPNASNNFPRNNALTSSLVNICVLSSRKNRASLNTSSVVAIPKSAWSNVSSS